ncbi:hypothetical protein DVH05_014552 [Phytophthora capsici]|nr:hypothetical protein DVH05_014552 [Phytophthora capsici]
MEEMFNSANGVRLGGNIVALTAVAIGIITVFLGHRPFRATLFTIGFAFGGTALAMITEQLFATEEWVVTASWVVFVIGGVLCGFFALCLTAFGILRLGRWLGSCWRWSSTNALGYLIHPSNPGVVLALLGGILAIKLENPILIVAISLFGAGILVWGVDYFAGDFLTFTDLNGIATQDGQGEWHYSIPGSWYAYLAGFAVLFVLSLCIQFHKTSQDGHYHRKHWSGSYL